MAEQREDIENLEERVTTTEDNVTNLGKEVDNTVVVVHGIREDVNEQETRLTEVEEVVEETVEKVEEIDKKVNHICYTKLVCLLFQKHILRLR